MLHSPHSTAQPNPDGCRAIGIAPTCPGPARRFPPPAHDAELVSVRYSVRDYHLEDIEYQRRHPGDFTPYGDAHYRFDIEEAHSTGSYEFCGILDGFIIMSVDAEYSVPRSAYFYSPDSLHIYLACSGDGEYAPVDAPPLSFQAPSAVLFMEPAGKAPAAITFAGHTRYIYIIIHREALQTLYGGSVHELPSALQSFLAGEMLQTSGRALQLSTAMMRCLDDVQTCTLEGRLRRLFLQSKALEIVCQALEAFGQNDGPQRPASMKHTARSILKAQIILSGNFASPPSLEKLASEVGLSRSAMCTGFRQLLGQSVYEYVRDRRMEQALTLLREGDDPIIQIAYAVGYSRPSSFSVAVQRHFGSTPSELRRKAVLHSA